ncbi:MAG: hypothetical protein ACK4MU_09340, partial [Thermomonas sp.]
MALPALLAAGVGGRAIVPQVSAQLAEQAGLPAVWTGQGKTAGAAAATATPGTRGALTSYLPSFLWRGGKQAQQRAREGAEGGEDDMMSAASVEYAREHMGAWQGALARALGGCCRPSLTAAVAAARRQTNRTRTP